MSGSLQPDDGKPEREKQMTRSYEVMQSGKIISSFDNLSNAFECARQKSTWSVNCKIEQCTMVKYADFEFIKLAEFRNGKQIYSYSL
jgi:hypothetical protein